MEFKKISAPSLKDLFVQQVENLILSGELPVGEQLPPERELAESMHVSRAVVNAGINEMAAKGFVEIRPRVGTFVGDYRRNGTAETLLSIMKYNGGRLGRDEVRSLLEIKLIQDRLAAQLAVRRMTDEDMAALRGRLQALQTAPDVTAAADAAFEFYRELALVSGNTLLPLIYHSFRIPVTSLWQRFGRKYGLAAVCAGVSRLFAALENRDEAAAVRCIEQTVGGTISGSTEIYDE